MPFVFEVLLRLLILADRTLQTNLLGSKSWQFDDIHAKCDLAENFGLDPSR